MEINSNTHIHKYKNKEITSSEKPHLLNYKHKEKDPQSNKEFVDDIVEDEVLEDDEDDGTIGTHLDIKL